MSTHFQEKKIVAVYVAIHILLYGITYIYICVPSLFHMSPQLNFTFYFFNAIEQESVFFSLFFPACTLPHRPFLFFCFSLLFFLLMMTTTTKNKKTRRRRRRPSKPSQQKNSLTVCLSLYYFFLVYVCVLSVYVLYKLWEKKQQRRKNLLLLHF